MANRFCHQVGAASATDGTITGPSVSPPRALILCGGGAGGAMEVGFYQAIAELDLSFELIVGSSVGALNGALIAAGLTAAELADLWSRIRRRDIARWDLGGLVAGRGGFLTLRPLRRLLEDTLPISRFEDLRHRLIIATTDLHTGTARYWSDKGEFVNPLIASMSLPGVFPPIWIEGRQHVDGAVASNVPLEPALAHNISEMLLIHCTCCPPDRRPLRSPLAILLRSFGFTLGAKFACDLTQYRRRGVRIQVVQPSFPKDVGLLDFEHTDGLIRAAYEQTLATLRTHTVGESVDRVN